VINQPWLRSVFGVTDPVNLWWGIQPISAGIFGLPLAIVLMIVVSLLTPAPDKETQDLVEHVRYPNLKGDSLNTQGAAG
jgi:cation/acetate symporter